MIPANDKQLLSALEQAIIGLSSALQDVEHKSEAYNELHAKIEQLFFDWRDLNNKLNPCDTKIND